MATHKSAIKRHRQSIERKGRNIAIKSTLRTSLRKLKDTIQSSNGEEAKKSLLETTTLLDKAVSKGVLHRNNASRKISKFTLKVNSIS